MSEGRLFEETGSKLKEELEVKINNLNAISEEQLLDAITDRVLELLERNPEILFSYLYRLDVLEHKIQFALNQQTQIPPHRALAKLILDRQKLRISTKRKYKQEPLKGWGFD